MSPDAIQQLKDLAALKEQGILTEDEFAAQKAKILAELTGRVSRSRHCARRRDRRGSPRCGVGGP